MGGGMIWERHGGSVGIARPHPLPALVVFKCESGFSWERSKGLSLMKTPNFKMGFFTKKILK
jgi:hypothetical protein